LCADRLVGDRNSFAVVAHLVASSLTVSWALRVSPILVLCAICVVLHLFPQRLSTVEVEVVGCIRELIIVAHVAVPCADRFVRNRHSHASLPVHTAVLAILLALRVCPHFVAGAILVLLLNLPQSLWWRWWRRCRCWCWLWLWLLERLAVVGP